MERLTFIVLIFSVCLYGQEDKNKIPLLLLSSVRQGVISISEKKEKSLKQEREEKRNTSFWRKLGFSIGYSGGICWTGGDLVKYGGLSFDLIELISRWLYWLNSIEGSVFYPLNEKWGIEIGGGYGWIRLENRNGWNSSFTPPDTTYMYGNLGGGSIVTIKRVNIFIGKVVNNKSIGIEIGYSNLKTTEILSYYRPNENWVTIDKSDVIRHYIGGGMCLFFKYPIVKTHKILIFLDVGGKIVFDFEILNNSPFKWTGAEKKVMLNFSGLYGGIKFKIGGVK